MRKVRLWEAKNLPGAQREGQSLCGTPGALAQSICSELSLVQDNVSSPAFSKTMKSAPVCVGHRASPRSVLVVRAASSYQPHGEINKSFQFTKIQRPAWTNVCFYQCHIHPPLSSRGSQTRGSICSIKTWACSPANRVPLKINCKALHKIKAPLGQLPTCLSRWLNFFYALHEHRPILKISYTNLVEEKDDVLPSDELSG